VDAFTARIAARMDRARERGDRLRVLVPALSRERT
jgi:hypothetical protein